MRQVPVSGGALGSGRFHYSVLLMTKQRSSALGRTEMGSNREKCSFEHYFFEKSGPIFRKKGPLAFGGGGAAMHPLPPLPTDLLCTLVERRKS